MLVSASKGQVGASTAVVGTNALIVNSTYTALITSVPQTSKIEDWIDDNMSKLASFKTPFTTIACGPGIALEGTAEPNHVPSYVFNPSC